jgi:hypothetical protein
LILQKPAGVFFYAKTLALLEYLPHFPPSLYAAILYDYTDFFSVRGSPGA